MHFVPRSVCVGGGGGGGQCCDKQELIPCYVLYAVWYSGQRPRSSATGWSWPTCWWSPCSDWPSTHCCCRPSSGRQTMSARGGTYWRWSVTSPTLPLTPPWPYLDLTLTRQTVIGCSRLPVIQIFQPVSMSQWIFCTKNRKSGCHIFPLS